VLLANAVQFYNRNIFLSFNVVSKNDRKSVGS